MANKKVTVTKAYIDQLKSERDRWKRDYEEIEKDRMKFRDFFLRLLKDNVTMSSKGEYYSPQTMINKLSKLMNDVKTWYWG